jgi:hypothetical protein
MFADELLKPCSVMIKPLKIVGEKHTHQCIYCEKSYEIYNSLHSHIIKVHMIKPIVCKMHKCYHLFYTKRDLAQHMKIEHQRNEDNTYKCLYCGKNFQAQQSLNKHVRDHHKEIYHKCEKCPQFFRTKKQKMEHLIKKHGEKQLLCIICGKGFPQNALRSRHTGQKHQNEAIKCTFQKYCNEWFKTNEDLQRHIREEHKNLTFKCLFCDRGNYSDKKFLAQHIRKKHVDVALWCDYTKNCSSCFKTDEDRKKHYKEKHESGEKMKTCILCNKKINYISYLVHLQNHHQHEKYFKCSYPICTEYFKTEEEQRKHIVEVHECFDEKFKCIYCGKFYARKRSLQPLVAHIHRVHSDIVIRCNGLKPCSTFFKTVEDRDKHVKSAH